MNVTAHLLDKVFANWSLIHTNKYRTIYRRSDSRLRKGMLFLVTDSFEGNYVISILRKRESSCFNAAAMSHDQQD